MKVSRNIFPVHLPLFRTLCCLTCPTNAHEVWRQQIPMIFRPSGEVEWRQLANVKWALVKVKLLVAFYVLNFPIFEIFYFRLLLLWNSRLPVLTRHHWRPQTWTGGELQQAGHINYLSSDSFSCVLSDLLSTHFILLQPSVVDKIMETGNKIVSIGATNPVMYLFLRFLTNCR